MTTTPARTAIIAGNWKMHYGPRLASSFALEITPALGKLLNEYPYLLCILCPPAISLSAVREVLDALLFERIELGAQNMHFEEKGAFTGEISPLMVRELCTTVIVGHSERRTYFGESDELVNRKAQAALGHGLRPIVCVGERLEEYEAGKTEAVIRSQVQASLANFRSERACDVVIAYEPVWAIGTGKACPGEEAQRTIRLIRELYADMYDSETANAVRILYGGSVTSANIAEYVAQADIDGALVGGASLKPDFVEIVRKSIEVLKQA
ncbi:triose-phosphate isomerase [Thermogemmatispora onikobensis]|uniref:triose-phosphate isomerase n=1 Tax=Thermogemmatispora onikobensis TaxID=732234 RepID=UPI000853B660|nr:triose-phosphate isomerase [Thermogemmatispora onikobensis]